MPHDPSIPVLIAVPHAGRVYPESLLARMRRPEYSAVRLEDRHVDQVARQVARLTGAGLLVAHAPRAMLDLNRATDDVDWEMIAGPSPAVRHSAANRRARSGLGLVPRRLPGLGEIWHGQMDAAELAARISDVHVPYHAALDGALTRLRDRWGAALLIDLHSMPPLRPGPAGESPAHMVVGDRFGASADDRLVAEALQYLGDAGIPVAHNRPYAGGYVLDRHAQPARAVHAIQLEICRSLYLDRELAHLTGAVTALAASIAGLVRVLGEATANLGRRPVMAVAAE